MKGETFKSLMSTFATGCTILTFPTDPPHGMTVNAFSSLSLRPPKVLVCIDHETRSYSLLDEQDVARFGVNILSSDQRPLAEHFANLRDLENPPFDSRPILSREDVDPPVFSRNLAYLICDVTDRCRSGDHTIFIGDVTDGERLREDADPLVFFDNRWGTFSGPRDRDG